MVYKWNAHKYAVNPNDVGKLFEKIEKKNGKLTRELVLEDARDESSIIHDCFEWNDTVAAENYRLTQATCLITNLDVVVETEEKKPVICRAFVNTSEGHKGAFVNINTAFQSQETKDLVMQRAIKELQAFERKYHDLKVFSNLFEEIESLVNKVG